MVADRKAAIEATDAIMTKPFLPPFSADTDGSVQRDKDRDSLFLKATMRLASAPGDIAVRVRNLSAGGMMGEAPVQVERGDVVHVDLRNVGDVPGKVAWKAEGRFGIAFDHPIDPKLVRQPLGSKDDRPNFIRKIDSMSRPLGRKG